MRRGFTLVEMLVVIGIVAVLAALLLPAAMMAVNAGRRTAQAVEVSQLAQGIEAYRKDKGDYPPNFRDADAFLRHVRRCYPKLAAVELNYFIDTTVSPPAWRNQLDEGEALVWWLSRTTDSPSFAFGVTPAGGNAPAKKYYEFDQKRLVDDDGDGFFSMRSKYARDTFYLYCDSRSYDELTDFASAVGFAYAEDASVIEGRCRPYWSDNAKQPAPPSSLDRDLYLPEQKSGFQILCAGLDGDFGFDAADADVKRYVSGVRYNDGDNDNQTSFSEGKRLSDAIP